MKIHERIEAIKNAQAKLQEGLEELRQALAGTRNKHYWDSYILGHLDNWINGGNPHDDTIPNILEKIADEFNWNIIWYREDREIGEETIEANTHDEAWAYAELKANNEYNADDFTVTETA